jgi:hypothetical protein
MILIYIFVSLAMLGLLYSQQYFAKCQPFRLLQDLLAGNRWFNQLRWFTTGRGCISPIGLESKCVDAIEA